MQNKANDCVTRSKNCRTLSYGAKLGEAGKPYKVRKQRWRRSSRELNLRVHPDISMCPELWRAFDSAYEQALCQLWSLAGNPESGWIHDMHERYVGNEKYLVEEFDRFVHGKGSLLEQNVASSIYSGKVKLHDLVNESVEFWRDPIKVKNHKKFCRSLYLKVDSALLLCCTS